MAYKVTETHIPDLLILEPTVFGDERGFFMESFNHKDFCDAVGSDVEFVQDNHSRSSRGVLRGLHYQVHKMQAKLVRVVSGAVLDVAVDLRKGSPTFGMWAGCELSAENKLQFWVPQGFAHGFIVLSDSADFLYKTTDYYEPEYEKCIIWNDREININWPKNITPILSEKDQNGQLFRDAEVIE